MTVYRDGKKANEEGYLTHNDISGYYQSGSVAYFINIANATSGQVILYNGSEIAGGSGGGGGGYNSGDAAFFINVVDTGKKSSAILEAGDIGDNLKGLMMVYGG